jgi:hypothetical protein
LNAALEEHSDLPPEWSHDATKAKPNALRFEPASGWADRAPPAPRDWIIKDILPAGRVTSMLGNGGLGKTTVAIQAAIHIAVSRSIFGLSVNGGPVVGIFCEDEQEELERRGRAACVAEGIELDTLDRLFVLSRDGQDNLLCTFDREKIVLTPFYCELDAAVAEIKPRLLILDTAADLFGGDFMSTPQVRQFLKVALGGLSVRHGCAVLLLAHPSSSAMNSGDGGGFSTAWNNSVRSRLYLRRPKTEDAEAAKDRRILEVKKANYGPDSASIPLIYDRGCFVPDLMPIEEGSTKPPRSRGGVSTKLGLAVVSFMRRTAPSAAVVPFRDIFEALQKDGLIDRGHYEMTRKPLQRVLKNLVEEGVLRDSTVPRGYRLMSDSPGHEL